MGKYLWLLFSSLIIVLNVQAQTAAQYIKKGDESFVHGDYYSAASFYRKALIKDDSNAEIDFKLGESCRLFNDYRSAADYYQMAMASDKNNVFQLTEFWLAEMKKSLGEYDDALQHFKHFKTYWKKKDYYSKKTTQEIESCAWAKNQTRDSTMVEIIHLGTDVNTEYTEFNPFENKEGKLQFSSIRNISPDESEVIFLSRIYNQDKVDGKYFTPLDANSKKNIANGSLSADKQRFYFTQCDNVTKAQLQCELFVCKQTDGEWTKAQRLSDKINLKNTTNTQPAEGMDSAGNRVLYFSSNRPKGFGNMDIWYCRIDQANNYSDPINLGATINTPGDEITPYYIDSSKQFYFSSDWHKGFGGYDIFQSTIEDNKWSKPENMGYPINTSCNEFSYYVNPAKHHAYFSSNRVGSLYLKAETCCNDIYEYDTEGNSIKKDSVVTHDSVPIAVLEKKSSIDTTTRIEKKTVLENKINHPTDSLPKGGNTTATIPNIGTTFDSQLKKIKQLIPVTLYFHNDEPECCNLRDTTALSYTETYQSYWAMLDEYKRNFAKGLKEGKKVEAEEAIFYLFTNRVDKGYRNLVQFSAQLLDLLNGGATIEIAIQGYCSPLNYNAYNIKLGYRRIATLRNHFYHYRDGALLPFIANGKLIMKNESFGEEKAEKNVSDNREDTRNSVYNPDAAKERKVEIISVQIK